MRSLTRLVIAILMLVTYASAQDSQATVGTPKVGASSIGAPTKAPTPVLKVVEPTATQQAALKEAVENLERQRRVIQDSAKAAENQVLSEVSGFVRGIGISLIGPGWDKKYTLVERQGKWVFEEIPPPPPEAPKQGATVPAKP